MDAKTMLKALRTYIGLGPEDEIDTDYLSGLDKPESESDGRARGSNSDPNSDKDHLDAEDFVAQLSELDGDSRSQALLGLDQVVLDLRGENESLESKSKRLLDEGLIADSGSGADRPSSQSNRQLDERSDRQSGNQSGKHPEEPEKVASIRYIDEARQKPRTIAPTSFSEAKEVADDFKVGVPVLLNLQAIDRDLARRLVDFASGLCYALDGSMEKVAPQAFLVIPDGVEVSEEDRRLIRERGYAR